MVPHNNFIKLFKYYKSTFLVGFDNAVESYIGKRSATSHGACMKDKNTFYETQRNPEDRKYNVFVDSTTIKSSNYFQLAFHMSFNIGHYG